MNSIDLSPLYRNSVGFDRLGALFNSALSTDATSATFPPYNIEAQADNRYAITLAVAGFTREQLDIQSERGVLTVKGNKNRKEKRNYLYKGFSNRAFESKFNLADYVEVTGADLAHGLLTIHLVKEVPEGMRPKTITINSYNEALEHDPGKLDENSSEAA